MKSHCISIRMTEIKRKTIPSIVEGEDQLKLSYSAVGDENGKTTLKKSLAVP